MVQNKYDLNLELSEVIEDYLKENKLPLLTKISFNKSMVKVIINKSDH